MHRIPIGVLGASGYAGRELCALIERHPRLSLAFATANEQRGKTAELPGGGRVTFVATDDAPLQSAQLVFSAMPHGASKIWVERVRAAGAKAVDLSADLRIGNDGGTVPYGLTEANREIIRGADLVANPGCYPTATLLGLLPLLEQNLVAKGATIAVSAASGVTGAGYSARTDLLFGEVTENFRAYGVGNTHRHLAEMRAMVAETGADVDLIFTPHLLPTARGILATMTVPLVRELPNALAPWAARYGERAVHRDRRTASGNAARCIPERRSHFRHAGGARAHADAAGFFRDRQSHERRRGTGGAKRESHARARRDARVAGVII